MDTRNSVGFQTEQHPEGCRGGNPPAITVCHHCAVKGLDRLGREVEVVVGEVVDGERRASGDDFGVIEATSK